MVGPPADGSLYGEGQGILMGRGGETASWVGQGVGTLKKDGGVIYRGALYYQTGTSAWTKLNSAAAVFEYEVDAKGAARQSLIFGPPAGITIEFTPRRRLREPHTSQDNLRSRVPLGPNRCADHSAQHGELPDVGERVGQWSLDQLFRQTAEWAV